MIKKIATYIGYFLAACTLIATLYGIFKGIYKTSDSLVRIEKQQEVIIDSIYSMSGKVQNLQIDVNAVNENSVLIGNYVEGINKGFQYHLLTSPEVTKDDWNSIMQIIEELKKKDNMTALK